MSGAISTLLRRAHLAEIGAEMKRAAKLDTLTVSDESLENDKTEGKPEHFTALENRQILVRAVTRKRHPQHPPRQPPRRALTRYLELAENDQQRQRAARLLQELSQQLH